MSEKNPIQSAERIFEILEYLAEHGVCSLTEIGTALSLSKSTTHRLLHSLCMMGYVTKDSFSGRYTLTFKILEIAGHVLDRIDVLAVAHRYIDRLMKQVHETVHFVQREGNHIVYVDKVESDASSIRMVSRIGLRMPMYCTGVGKAMLAQMTEREVREIWESTPIEKCTENTITDLDVLLRELAEIRLRGYAIDNEENEIGVRCIAACVQDYTGRADAAFSISAPAARMPDERLREFSDYVLQTRRDISRELGYRG
ncbi:MAG TPA: IclR family transcriptional regulator [Candidatus Gallacutalibacter pullicola]|uniref:Glycerol operon regulatory protein n=1 Tax=Candidatus Gallacutalibacter pullicola TaxID=2840830 RepID=A0A9D1DRQ7_9FIRM|nr:IclR family transcriptional regulator [Candidatus Gallacutalibacter pullicola]